MPRQRKTLEQKGILNLLRTADAYAIELSQGHWAVVSSGDLATVRKYNWCVQVCRGGRQRYAITCVRDPVTGKQKRIYMHRLLLDAGRGQIVDHISGNGLDNRRCNIRLANHSTNGANRKRGTNNTTGYKGVSWDSKEKKWRAGIKANGKSENLGNYKTKEEAAQAYAQAAKFYFGEFAREG